MDMLLIGTLIVIAALLVFIIIQLKWRLSPGNAATQLEHLYQSMQQIQTHTAVLAERIGSVEQNQSQAGQSIVAIGTRLAETGVVAQTLVEATGAIREEVVRAKNNLTEIQTHAKARQEIEQQTAESIKRLEAIIAGTQTKGSAGENIVEVVFAKLPPEWQVRNFRVGDKVVEFGLRLPNNLILPIDSKWAATNLLEQFVESEDPNEQQRLKSQIETAVLGRTKEVRKYIDPNLTVSFAIAAVPDAIYDLCCGIQADVFRLNVVLIGYSMLVPYLLLVFQTILRASQSIDLQRLDVYLQSAQENVKSLQDEVEGRFSRAITMLGNSRDDMATHLSRLGGGLTSLQISTSESPPAALPEPVSGEL